MRLRHYIIIALIVPFLVLFRFAGKLSDNRSGLFRVTRVIDGDTVVLDGAETVRLLGIDAPEKDQPLYDSATALLAGLVLDKSVVLSYDFRRRDPYGRLLAYVFLDTLFVNACLIDRGLASVYLFPNNMTDDTLVARLLAAQRTALAANAGIWSVPVPAEERYIGNRNSLRFHRPRCRSAQTMKAEHIVYFDSRESALLAGYAPCRNCRP